MQGFILVVCFLFVPESNSKTILNLTNTQSEIIKDLSWNTKPAVLKNFANETKSKNENKDVKLVKHKVSEEIQLPNIKDSLKQIVKKDPKPEADDRKVGILAQVESDDNESSSSDEDENIPRSKDCSGSKKRAKSDLEMKTRMFSLMYGTVRDTELKVKRAEQIREYYANDTDFEVGFLMGEASDKFNSIMEVAATVKRLYKEWKPLDHINAYEQIANQAIQINTVVELILSKSKAHEKEEAEAEATRALKIKQQQKTVARLD